MASDLGLDNVEFIDPIPRERVQDLLAHVDAGLCHYTVTPVYRYGVSFNKLFDYMAAARPIVFACQTYRDPVTLSGGGWSIVPDDPEALAAALAAVADLDPEERSRIGKAGRAFLEQEHDMARIAGEFATIVGCEEAA
jgi:glycosyltransferase involved in cell wall biosynthesis